MDGEKVLVDGDYVLAKDEAGVWLTVDTLSVRVRRTDEGVVVDIYPLGKEHEDAAVASTYAFFGEGESDA